MRLMAGVAEGASGVFDSSDLGEPGGFGGILLMAAAAEVGDVGKLRDVGGRIVGMLGEGAVAGFAVDAGMFAGSLDLGHFVVAHDAGVLAGVGDGFLANEVEGAGPVVAVLAEAFRDDGGTDGEEQRKSREKDDGGADEMGPLPEYAAH